MNPQFFPPLQVRPKLVPVIVRPTVPVAFTSFTQPHVTSPIQHGNTLFTFGVSPDVILDSPTTAKTRRELEQLGSTEHATELIFELAARKNGIRIGVDPGSKGNFWQQIDMQAINSIIIWLQYYVPSDWLRVRFSCNDWAL